MHKALGLGREQFLGRVRPFEGGWQSNVDTAGSGQVPGKQAGACEMNFLCTVWFPMCQKNKLGEVCLDHVSVWTDPSLHFGPLTVEKNEKAVSQCLLPDLGCGMDTLKPRGL